MPISHHLPWQVNVAAKVVLSRMPVSRRIWKRVGFFNLGDMESPEYAFLVFQRHFNASGLRRERERERERDSCAWNSTGRLSIYGTDCFGVWRFPDLSS